MPQSMRAFSLIELLVVITIVVLLLTLLTPAIDRAVYLADLTMCGARLKACVTGMTVHAIDRQRLYPERVFKSQWIEITGGGLDGRPILREYMGPLNKLLNCPLQKGVDLEITPASTGAIAGGYGLFNDWITSAGEKPMRRVGDRWTWKGETFALLADDYELYTDYLYSTHPDQGEILTEIVYQDHVPWGLDMQGQRTIDTWYSYPLHTRGLLDRNFGYEDGSVIRLDRLATYDKDERLTTMPWAWGDGDRTPQYWEVIPRPR